MPTTFMGHRMDQEWADINIWEHFFVENPIKTFIEIGTGNGGLSIYFALQCYQRGIQFHTFDNQNWIDYDEPLPASLRMKQAFHHIDIFSDADQVISVIENSPKPLAIFFDDGDKPREWRMFGPHTAPGDYLIVHDWGTEFFPSDIGNIPLERILVELSDARPNGWKAMWFKRV